VLKLVIVELAADRANAPIHHVRGRNDVRARAGVRKRRFGEQI